MKKKIFLPKNCYPLSFPIVGGHNSTRALQSSLFLKYKNLKKLKKNTFFPNTKKKIFLAGKKYSPLSFPILGGRDSTTAL